MRAISFRFRAELRRRWRAWLGLAVLVGISGGVVMALGAGARRTDSSYARLRAEQQLFDVLVFDGGFLGDIPVPPDFLAQVAALPEVEEAAVLSTIFEFGGRTADGVAIGEPDYLQTIVATDDGAVRMLARTKVLEGHHADPTAVDEVTVNFTVAEKYDLGVGDRFELDLAREDDALAFELTGAEPELLARTFRVVGVVATAGDFPPRSLGDGAGAVFFTPAFLEAEPEVTGLPAVAARLVDGEAAMTEFRAGVESIVGEDGPPFDAFGTGDIALQHAATDRAIHLLAIALWILAGLAALAVVLVVGQALLRAAVLESNDNAMLQALGFTAGDLTVLNVARGAVVAVAGAVIAVAVSVGLSPVFPLGLARTAEPHPGVRVDGLALLAGVAVIVLVVGAVSAVAGRRATTRTGRRELVTARTSRVGSAMARRGFPPPAIAGVRMALEAGRGRTAVPVRSALVGAVVGVTALVGALTFTAGLEHLLDTPRLYGWNWDVSVGDGYGRDVYEEVVPVLTAAESVDGVAAGTFGALDVEGREIFVLAVDPVEGSVGATVIEGRVPSAPGEILLGSATLDRLGVSVGDEVDATFVGTFQGEARTSHDPEPLRIVGRGVLPEQSDIGLDDAGAMTYRGLVQLAGEGEDLPRNFFPVRFAEDTDPTVALRDLTESVGTYTVPLQRPTDLVNFGRVDTLPLVAGGLLALVAMSMIVHLLLSSVRRRRRDLALLKTLGFTGRQVLYAVGWQASTLVVVALLVGIPLGVAAGRFAWTIAAQRLGVAVEAVVPFLELALLVPLTVLVANVVAAVPGWLAARTRTAVVLRAE